MKFCKEKDMEICAVKIHLSDYTIYIMAIYRSPGNFLYFLNNLETILNIIYESSIEIIICGDININYLNDSTHKRLLDSLLASYCLNSTVQFPTRIHNNSLSAIDNIFINNIKFNNFSISPFVNGMSDHDAQIIAIHNLTVQNCNNYFYFGRKIDKCSIIDFNTKLNYESWEDIFTDNDVNTIFNNFLNIYLRILYSSFPLKKIFHRSFTKAWLTTGIKTSCINKRKLFLTTRNSNDPNLLNYYKKYCRILTGVIKLAKKNSIAVY
jgi:hypothetical protein